MINPFFCKLFLVIVFLSQQLQLYRPNKEMTGEKVAICKPRKGASGEIVPAHPWMFRNVKKVRISVQKTPDCSGCSRRPVKALCL